MNKPIDVNRFPKHLSVFMCYIKTSTTSKVPLKSSPIVWCCPASAQLLCLQVVCWEARLAVALLPICLAVCGSSVTTKADFTPAEELCGREGVLLWKSSAKNIAIIYEPNKHTHFKWTKTGQLKYFLGDHTAVIQLDTETEFNSVAVKCSCKMCV